MTVTIDADRFGLAHIQCLTQDEKLTLVAGGVFDLEKGHDYAISTILSGVNVVLEVRTSSFGLQYLSKFELASPTDRVGIDTRPIGEVLTTALMAIVKQLDASPLTSSSWGGH